MEKSLIGFDDLKRLGKCQAEMQAPPFSRVPHPVKVKPARSHAVDSGEARIEFRTLIVLHTRPESPPPPEDAARS